MPAAVLAGYVRPASSNASNRAIAPGRFSPQRHFDIPGCQCNSAMAVTVNMTAASGLYSNHQRRFIQQGGLFSQGEYVLLPVA